MQSQGAPSTHGASSSLEINELCERSFAHLHGHSTYSWQDGCRSPEKIGERIQELGHSAVALTDHGTVCSHVPLQIAAKKLGFKPIFGTEAYVVNDISNHDDTLPGLGAHQFPHVTLLARTQRGYENLLALSRISWLEGRWYKPRIDWSLIERHQEGLIVLSGCPLGFPTRKIMLEDETVCFEWLRERQQRIEHFYLELVPAPDFETSHKTLGPLTRMSSELKLPPVLTADGHFPRPEDHQVQDLMLCVSIGKRASDPREFRLPWYQYYCTEEELIHRAQHCAPDVPLETWKIAAANTGIIAAGIDVELPRAERMHFVGLEVGETALQRIWCDAWRGLKEKEERLCGELSIYTTRLEHEIDVLARNEMIHYVLIAADLVQGLKRLGALVVARGSAGGSLLLWLLGITNLDPIRHGLLFSRFFDDTRKDPVDIDLDFEQAYRQQAIEYVESRYGKDHTCHLAAFSQIKPRSALNDAAFYYGISRAECAPLTRLLSSADDDIEHQLHEITDPAARAVLARHPELAISASMVGEYRNPSIHAAGLLISPIPLHQVIGLMRGQKDKQNSEIVASVDKRGAAYLGFVKIDLLSVMALDVVASAVRAIGKPMSWLETLPLDDPEALGIAQKGLLAGIFQLNGPAAARVAREIGIDRFEDLVVASALCRPGPAEWVEVYKRHKENPSAFADYLAGIHLKAAEIVAPTYGVLLTQEQVMRLARELCGLDWPDVQKFRKAIGDKMYTHPDAAVREAWIAEWREKIVGGCLRAGCSPVEAEMWWHSCATHGGYSFCLSHVTTYGLVGYWTCYLKAHYPAALYDSYLSHETDAITMKRLIREFLHLGGRIEMLNPRTSKATFSSPEPGLLVGGYVNLHGIGAKNAAQFAARAPYESWESLLEHLPPHVAQRIRHTGVSNEVWDPQETIIMAPWFPVPRLGDEELGIRRHYRLPTLDQLPQGTMISGDVVVCGYVTATQFERHKVLFCLEDETSSIVVRVSRSNMERLGPEFRQLSLADFVIVRGWWTGDALYPKQRIIAKPSNLETRQDRREAEDWMNGIFGVEKPRQHVDLSREAARQIGRLAVEWEASLAHVCRRLIHQSLNIAPPEPENRKEVKAREWAVGNFSVHPKTIVFVIVDEEVGRALGRIACEREMAVPDVMRALIFNALGLKDSPRKPPSKPEVDKDARPRPPVPTLTEEEIDVSS